MIIPVMFFLMAYLYALAVNIIPSYCDAADKVGEGKFGLSKERDLVEKEKV
jgi:hypothetical protein